MHASRYYKHRDILVMRGDRLESSRRRRPVPWYEQRRIGWGWARLDLSISFRECLSHNSNPAQCGNGMYTRSMYIQNAITAKTRLEPTMGAVCVFALHTYGATSRNEPVVSTASALFVMLHPFCRRRRRLFLVALRSTRWREDPHAPKRTKALSGIDP